MKAGSGRLIAVAAGALGLGTLAVAGVTFREPIAEAYERWRSGYELGIRREGGRVWMTLRNRTDREMRIFQFWNSWGYWSVSFRVRDRSTGKIGVIDRLPLLLATGPGSNLPVYVSMPPPGSH